MESDNTPARLCDRHDELITERGRYYDGNAPYGEIARWVVHRLERLGTEHKPECISENRDRTLVDVWRDLIELYQTFDDEFTEEGTAYDDRIAALLATFEYPIPTRVVAEVIGCSNGHARRFYWDDTTRDVREKEWARRQREEQVPPRLVSQILVRDRHRCVRCSSRKELVVHHVTPVNAGGTAEEENLATLCSPCHQGAHGGALNTGEVVYNGICGFRSWISG